MQVKARKTYMQSVVFTDAAYKEVKTGGGAGGANSTGVIMNARLTLA